MVSKKENAGDLKPAAKMNDDGRVIPTGTVYEIEVEGKFAYLGKPTRHTREAAMGYAAPVQGRPQYIRAGEIILLGSWLGGDEEIKTNEDLLIPACMQAFQTMNTATATLKKV